VKERNIAAREDAWQRVNHHARQLERSSSHPPQEQVEEAAAAGALNTKKKPRG
jgi:hypothetical protein